MGDYRYFKNMLQKIYFYEKVKMTKGPFVVEYFAIVGSFDCDCTHTLAISTKLLGTRSLHVQSLMKCKPCLKIKGIRLLKKTCS